MTSFRVLFLTSIYIGHPPCHHPNAPRSFLQISKRQLPDKSVCNFSSNPTFFLLRQLPFTGGVQRVRPDNPAQASHDSVPKWSFDDDQARGHRGYETMVGMLNTTHPSDIYLRISRASEVLICATDVNVMC
jgi:hypothetical protein